MPSQSDHLVHFLVLSTVGEWLSTLGLIFGGCCSNALALELITSQHTHAGTLITFAQFLLITIFGLRKQLTILPSPVTQDEALKCISSLLNKARSSAKDAKSFKVALAGPDNSATNAFADELAAYLPKTQEKSEVLVKRHNNLLASEVVLGSEPARSFDLKQSSDDSMLSVQINGASLRPSISKTMILCCNDGLSDVNLQDADFVIYLRGTPVSFSKPSEIVSQNTSPQIVLDITNSSHPIIVYPYNSSFFPNLLRVRFKRRHIPISRYLVQVVLFLLVNLLNNAAFAYRIPMAVHIIFRSGGLVINMIMGWLIEGRRYTKTQVASVFLVTLGVALTTLSSMESKPSRGRSSGPSATASTQDAAPAYLTYATGILILTLALVLSGFLGLAQDRAFAEFGRGHWEEAMFYLHALALPMFAAVGPELSAQVSAVNAGPSLELGLHTIAQPFQMLSATLRTNQTTTGSQPLPPLPFLPVRSPTLRVPAFYIPLILNIITQLVCVAGVNRLTARVNSLTVALVLVVRKAVSLAISVLLLGNSKGNTLLWGGAAAVVVGTVGYTVGGGASKKSKKE